MRETICFLSAWVGPKHNIITLCFAFETMWNVQLKFYDDGSEWLNTLRWVRLNAFFGVLLKLIDRTNNNKRLVGKWWCTNNNNNQQSRISNETIVSLSKSKMESGIFGFAFTFGLVFSVVGCISVIVCFGLAFVAFGFCTIVFAFDFAAGKLGCCSDATKSESSIVSGCATSDSQQLLMFLQQMLMRFPLERRFVQRIDPRLVVPRHNPAKLSKSQTQ